jgi:hypothetical protein
MSVRKAPARCRGRPAPDLQQVAKPPRGDQRHPAAAALQKRVGRNRSAMGQAAYGGEVDVVLAGQFAQAGHNGLGRVVRRRRPLSDPHSAAAVLVGVKIREGAADIDTDGPAHRANP